MQWCRSLNLPSALCGADGHAYVGLFVHRLLSITALMRCGPYLCDTSVLGGTSDGPCSARSACILPSGGLINFRFFVPDLGRLSSLLDLQVDVSRRRYNVSPIKCLAIVLRRLASPCRWTDLELLFGRSASSLSEIFCRGVDELIGRWGHLITIWRAALMA